MDIILASQNQHKVEEISKYLAETKLCVNAASQSLEVIEDGISFQENALLKAKAYFEKFQAPTLSDDSGLCLDSFPELLGIHSARFAPQFPDYKDKCEEVLKLYQTKKELSRKAYFISIICLYLSPEEIYFFEGRTFGSISHQVSRGAGFGYDPIFIPKHHPEGLSYAQDTLWKDQHGHRSKAISELTKFSKSL